MVTRCAFKAKDRLFLRKETWNWKGKISKEGKIEDEREGERESGQAVEQILEEVEGTLDQKHRKRSLSCGHHLVLKGAS